MTGPRRTRSTAQRAVPAVAMLLTAALLAIPATVSARATGSADGKEESARNRAEIMQLLLASEEQMFRGKGFLATISDTPSGHPLSDDTFDVSVGIDFANGRSAAAAYVTAEYAGVGWLTQVVSKQDGTEYRDITRDRYVKRSLELLGIRAATHAVRRPGDGTPGYNKSIVWYQTLPGQSLEPMMLSSANLPATKGQPEPGVTTYAVTVRNCNEAHCPHQKVLLEFRNGLLHSVVEPSGRNTRYTYGPRQIPLPPRSATVRQKRYGEALQLSHSLAELRPKVRAVQRRASKRIQQREPRNPARELAYLARDMAYGDWSGNTGAERRGEDVFMFVDHRLAHDAWRLRWQASRNRVQARHLRGWQP